MKQDRFLLAILGVIGVLIIAAVSLFFIRQEPQEYGSEESPEGVVRNYVLSLQLGDYQRAYKYLQVDENKPDFHSFQVELLRNENEFPRAVIQIGETELIGTSARVNTTIIHSDNDPFSSDWVEDTPALLSIEENKWYIVSMPYPYWGWDWYIREIKNP